MPRSRLAARPRAGVALALALAATCVAAAAAAGNLPDPPHAIVPDHLSLAALSADGPDREGAFQVTVFDLANNPVPLADVLVDLSACADLRPCAVEIPGQTWYAPSRAWRVFADARGVARFVVPGGSTGAPATVFAPCARIYADGVLLATVPVAIYDLDGSHGLGAADLSLWLAEFLGGAPSPRADYDGSGHVSAADLSILLRVMGQGTSIASCGSFQP